MMSIGDSLSMLRQQEIENERMKREIPGKEKPKESWDDYTISNKVTLHKNCYKRQRRTLYMGKKGQFIKRIKQF